MVRDLSVAGMSKRLRKRYGCPVELSLEFVGGKWKTVILAWLKEAPHRYSELRARMPGVADKVLTERLKELEILGLVSKEPANGRQAARVYCLTERGESLRPVLDALYAWGEAIAADLAVEIDKS
jgi:DNA-binding HxlR family transcriptional regulator